MPAPCWRRPFSISVRIRCAKPARRSARQASQSGQRRPSAGPPERVLNSALFVLLHDLGIEGADLLPAVSQRDEEHPRCRRSEEQMKIVEQARAGKIVGPPKR